MIDVDAYCRELETYLCRKNDGHLIRITGPAFERVSAWAHQGIPLKVAEAGIDRYFERYYRKGPRRRPVRIDFCEADVLDTFDDWRRSLGLSMPVASEGGGSAVEEPLPSSKPRRSLAKQVDAALARLTILRGSDRAGRLIGPALETAVRALDAIGSEAAKARGDARDALVRRLADVDAALLAAAAAALDAPLREAFEREAETELAPFRSRMASEAYVETRRAAIARLVRAHFGLPEI